MALIYDAQLSPTKPEIISSLLSKASWFEGDVAKVIHRGAYRFDDPAGVTGFETHIVEDEFQNLYQVPLSYRPAPSEAAQSGFITEMEHSVLDRRWIYDARFDPDFQKVLAAVLNGQQHQAEEMLYVNPDELKPLSYTFLVSVDGSQGSSVSAQDAVARLEHKLRPASEGDVGLLGRFPDDTTFFRLA